MKIPYINRPLPGKTGNGLFIYYEGDEKSSLGLDVSDFLSALQKLEASLNRSMDSFKNFGKQVSRVIESVTGDIKDLNTTTKNIKDVNAKVKISTDKGELDDLRSKLNSLKKQIAQLSGIQTGNFLTDLDSIRAKLAADGQAFTNFARTATQTIYGADQEITGFRDSLEAINEKGVKVNIVVNRDALGNITRVVESFRSAKKVFAEVSDQAQHLSGVLAHLGAGGTQKYLDIAKKPILGQHLDIDTLQRAPSHVIDAAIAAEDKFRLVTKDLLDSGELTEKEIQNLFNKISTGTLDRIPKKIRDIGKEAINATKDLIQAARDLSTIKGPGLQFTKQAPTDIIRASLTKQEIAAAPEYDRARARKSQTQFRKVVDDTLISGKATAEELADVFSRINTGNFDGLRDGLLDAANPAILAFEKLGTDIAKIQSASGGLVNAKLQAKLGKQSGDLIRGFFDPQFLKKTADVTQFQSSVPDATKARELELRSSAERTRYNASIVSATQQIKKLDLKPEQFDAVFDNIVSGGGVINSFVGDQSRLFDILIRVQNALDGVGKAATSMGAKLKGSLDNSDRASQLANALRGTINTRLTAATPQQEPLRPDRRLDRTIGRIGEEAVRAGADINKLDDIYDKVVSGLITNTDQAERGFKRLTGTIISLHDRMIELREIKENTSRNIAEERRPLIPIARRELETSFKPTPEQLAIGSPQEITRLKREIQETVDVLYRLNGVDISQFNKNVGAVLAGADEQFTGFQQTLYRRIQRINDALGNIGAQARNKERIRTETFADLTNSEKRIVNVTQQRLGVPRLDLSITEADARKLYNTYKDAIVNVSKLAIHIDNTGLETAMDAAVNLIKQGESALTGLPADIQVVARALSGLITVYDRVGEANLKAFRNKPRTPYLPEIRALIPQTPQQQLSIATDQEKAALTRSTQGISDAFLKLRDINIDRFKTIVTDVISGTIRDLEGQEHQLQRVVQDYNKDLGNLGQSFREQQTRTANLTGREGIVAAVATRRIGTPASLNTDVDQRRAEQLNSTYIKLLRTISELSLRADINLNPQQIDDAANAALKGAGTFSTLDANVRRLAESFLQLITATKDFERANDSATQKAQANASRTAKASQTAAQQAQTILKTPQYYDLVKSGAPGVPSLVSQLRPGSEGKLPSHSSEGDLARINTQMANIATILASGKASLQDYSAAIDAIANKKLLPPSPVEEINRLRASVSGVANQLSIAENRADSFNSALIRVSSIVRLTLIREFFAFDNAVRNLVYNGIESFNKLAVQIGQIQAITQDAAASTSEWASTLRQISDVSGGDVVEVSAASYDALSNQITRAKEDTQEFLNVATQFARTVGATPTEAVNLLSSSINAFGKSARDAEQLSAEFFATIDIGRIRAQDLMNIFARAALAGQHLGSTSTELNAALAVLTQNGLTTEDAITRLNNVFVKLLNPTKEMDALFTKFGVTNAQQMVKIHGFIGTIQELEKAIRRGDAAAEELFPEIRTFAGFLGLTGQNAVKFADALEQLTNSTGRYNKAVELTSNTVGQKFAVEMQRIKNIFTVDLAQGFVENLVSLNDTIGGISNRISNLISISTTLGSIAIYPLALATAWKTVSISISLASKAFKLFGGLTLVTNPIGQFALLAIGAYGAVKAALDSLTEAQKKYVESLGKAKVDQYQNQPAKILFDEANKRVTEHSKLITDSIPKAWAIVASNMTLVLDAAINKQKKNLEGLSERLKSAFADVSNIVGKTISSMQNFPREATALQRKLPIENIQFQGNVQKDYFEQLLEAQKSYDSQAGVQGVTGTQVHIYDRIVELLSQETSRLKTEASNILTKTLDVGEIKSAHDAYINSLDQQIAKYQQLQHEIISTGAQAGKSWTAIQHELDSIVTPRLAPLIQQREAAPVALSQALDQRKKTVAASLEPTLQLKGQIEEAERVITSFNPEDLKHKKPEEIDRDIFKPMREQKTAIEKSFREIQPHIEIAGLKEDMQAAINNLNQMYSRVQAARLTLTQDILSRQTLENNTRDINAFSQNAVARIKDIDDAIQALDKSIGTAFSKLPQLAHNIPVVGEATQPRTKFSDIFRTLEPVPAGERAFMGKVDYSKVIELNKQLQIVRDTAAKPLSENYITDLIKAIDEAQKRLDAVKSSVPKEIFDESSAKKAEEYLNVIRQNMGSIVEAREEMDKQFARKTNVESQGQALFDTLNKIPTLFKTDNDTFKKWLDNKRELVPILSGQIEELNSKLRTTNQLFEVIKGPGSKPDISRFTNPGEGVPTVPTPQSTTVNEAVPVTNAALVEAINNLTAATLRAQGTPAAAAAPAAPVEEAMGGMIYYSHGGSTNNVSKLNRYNKKTIYAQSGMLVNDSVAKQFANAGPRNTSFNMLQVPVDPLTGILDLSQLNLNMNMQSGGIISYYQEGGTIRDKLASSSNISNGCTFDIINGLSCRGSDSSGVKERALGGIINYYQQGGVTRDKLASSSNISNGCTFDIINGLSCRGSDSSGVKERALGGIVYAQTGGMLLSNLIMELFRNKKNINEKFNTYRNNLSKSKTHGSDFSRSSNLVTRSKSIGGGPTYNFNILQVPVNPLTGILDLSRLNLSYTNMASGGTVRYYAKGGWTWMQPRGTDTIPAMLTPGEYVMPRKQTEKYLPILHRMRVGTYADGGEIDDTLMHSFNVDNLSVINDQRTQSILREAYNTARANTIDRMKAGTTGSDAIFISSTSRESSRYPNYITSGTIGAHDAYSRWIVSKSYDRSVNYDEFIEGYNKGMYRMTEKKMGMHSPTIRTLTGESSTTNVPYASRTNPEQLRTSLAYNARQLRAGYKQVLEKVPKKEILMYLFPNKPLNKIYDLLKISPAYYEKGGWTWMQSRGTDTTPAMLTPGEYVIPKEQTQKYLPILHRMRVGTYADGGEVSRNVTDLINSWNKKTVSSTNSIKREDLEAITKLFLSRPLESYNLGEHLYEKSVPRKILTKEIRSKGVDTTSSSKELLSNMFAGESPTIKMGGSNLSNKRANFISISDKKNEFVPDQIAALAHELEHAKQPAFRLVAPLRSTEDIRDKYSDLSNLAKEIPASIGDIAFGAKSYERATNRPLSLPIGIGPSTTHNTDWMVNQAEKHGYFSGRSMTELLATPSGQAYLKKLLSGSSKQSGGMIDYYKDGGFVNIGDSVRDIKYSTPKTESTSVDNSNTTKVTMHINVSGDINRQNMGRKIGKEIQREIRRGNLKRFN